MPPAQRAKAFESYSLKLSIAQLRPQGPVLSMIERWCGVMQELWVKATLLANQCILDPALPRESIRLYFENTTWWEHHIKIWSTLPATAKYDEVLKRGKGLMDSITPSTPLDVTNMSQVINFAAEQLKTMASNMLKSRFSPLLRQAFRRRIILIMRSGVELPSAHRHRLEARFVHQFKKLTIPSYNGKDLQIADIGNADVFRADYDELVRNWQLQVPDFFQRCSELFSLHADVDEFKKKKLLLPEYAELKRLDGIAPNKLTVSQKESKKALLLKLNAEAATYRSGRCAPLTAEYHPTRVHFMMQLHAERRADAEKMRTLDGASKCKLNRCTAKAFWNCCKTGLLLPLADYDVKCIRLDHRALVSLVAAAKNAEDEANAPMVEGRRPAGGKQESEQTRRPMSRL